jgi:hypothetical protein
MVSRKQHHWLVAVGIGLAGGVLVGGYWPHTPLHAVATDRAETFAMATGPVDADVEAVYILDFLTGDLKALVLGKQPGTFSGFFQCNVAADLGIDPQKNPKFVMVTGVINLRRGGGSRAQYGSALCYVAEITSGKMAAYAVPWTPSMFASGLAQSGPLALVSKTPFRHPVGMSPAPAGPAAGPPN